MAAYGFGRSVECSKTYKYVYQRRKGLRIIWSGEILGRSKWFDTEREAALFVDKVLIENGKSPVNILKLKQQ